MLSQISFTFGSMPVLLEIIKKHPDRDFRLLQATGDNSKLALFDLSGKPTIFNSPITLETLYSVGNDKFKGILHFESFELGTEDKNLLRKQAKIALDSADHSKMTTGYMFSRPDQTNATILITTWTNAVAIDDWTSSTDFAPLAGYMDYSPRSVYYYEDYRPAE